MEARRMKVLDRVRSRLQRPYVMKMRLTPTRERHAPILSRLLKV